MRTHPVVSWCSARLCALHCDERGAISVLSVATIFVMTVVLGMVINAGRQVDDKIRLQNAADAATYSGAVVLSRGYNALAFANHVEAEVFALTAYFRAGRGARATLSSEQSVLQAWDRVGAIFSQSAFPKFAELGVAIQQKVPLELEVVRTFLQMTDLQSALVLPVLESILRGPQAAPGGPPDPLGGAIPRFQRAVLLTTPQAAQTMASEIARMHGNMNPTGVVSRQEKLHRGRPLTAVLWRTDVTPLSEANELDPFRRTMPVFDPSPGGPDSLAFTADYFELARCLRKRSAQATLQLWSEYLLDPFFRGIPVYNPMPPYQMLPGGKGAAKASALYWIWEIYTCWHLDTLLNYEYKMTNLPFVYRLAGPPFDGNEQCMKCQSNLMDYDCGCMEGEQNRRFEIPDGYRQFVQRMLDPNQNPRQPSYLEQYHQFIGVAYWPRLQQTSPVFFRYPLAVDALAFAQASVFIPRARFVKSSFGSTIPWLHPTGHDLAGNWYYANNYDNWPQDWDLNYQRWVSHWNVDNQNWIAQLMPVTSDSLPAILQSSLAQKFAPGLQVPNLGGAAASDLRRINTH